MQLFQVREPSNGVETPGLPISSTDPIPRVRLGYLPDGSPYDLLLGGHLREVAKYAAPTERLLAADFIKRDGASTLLKEVGWMDPNKKRRCALVLLDTSAGDGGKLILTGPNGAPEVQKSADRPEVTRLWMPFNYSPGLFHLSEDVVSIQDDGVVEWKHYEADKTPFVLISMLKGAFFRVSRTGDLDDAPEAFSLSWNGYTLRSSILRGRPRTANPVLTYHATPP